MPPFQPRNHPGSPYSFPRAYPPYSMPPHMPKRPRGRGGFLRNLLSKKGGSGGKALTGFERQRAAGSFISPAAQKLANPASLQDMLANTQQFLQTMQQMGPMVQQYGPIVKNLPAMWKLYRGLKNLPDLESESAEEKNKESKPSKKSDSTHSSEPAVKKKPQTAAKQQQALPQSKPKQQQGVSKPKLYI